MKHRFTTLLFLTGLAAVLLSSCKDSNTQPAVSGNPNAADSSKRGCEDISVHFVPEQARGHVLYDDLTHDTLPFRVAHCTGQKPDVVDSIIISFELTDSCAPPVSPKLYALNFHTFFFNDAHGVKWREAGFRNDKNTGKYTHRATLTMVPESPVSYSLNSTIESTGYIVVVLADLEEGSENRPSCPRVHYDSVICYSRGNKVNVAPIQDPLD